MDRKRRPGWHRRPFLPRSLAPLGAHFGTPVKFFAGLASLLLLQSSALPRGKNRLASR